MIKRILFISIVTVYSMLTAFNLYSQEKMESIVVITNSASSISDINSEKLRRLFLGKITSVKGNKLLPITAMKTKSHDFFRKTTLKLTSKTEKAYWLKERFKGTITAVKQCKTENEILEFASRDRRGIGCISERLFDEISKSKEYAIKAITIDYKDYKNVFYKLK